jgi:hypothetical protein
LKPITFGCEDTLYAARFNRVEHPLKLDADLMDRCVGMDRRRQVLQSCHDHPVNEAHRDVAVLHHYVPCVASDRRSLGDSQGGDRSHVRITPCAKASAVISIP